MLRIAKEALTFDDVLLVPAHSTVLPNTADLSTQLTKTIRLNIPMLSAAMDTVTEARLAIALAQEGGIGFIHKNMSIERQAEEVRRVKKHESGVVTDPQTVLPTTTLREVKVLTERNGFAGYPVVTEDNELVGIITGRDVRFVTDLNQPVSVYMTPKERLVTVREGESREVVFAKMHEKRVEKALVVDDSFHLLGMITVKDFQKAERKPNACKDEQGRLRVGAAVGAGAGNEERVDALVAAGVDILLIDSSHGHSEGVLQRIRDTRAKYPDLQIIGGNVATGAGARALAEAGCSAVKVGIGPGSICTTRIVTGVGVPQITAVSDAVEALEGTVSRLSPTAVSVSPAISRKRLPRARPPSWSVRCWRVPKSLLAKSNSIRAVLTSLTAVWVPWARCLKVPPIATSRPITPPTNWCRKVSKVASPIKGV